MGAYREFVALGWLAAHVCALHMQIDEFYSKSFVPNTIFISYSLDGLETLNYNLTVRQHFPGKLLMQIYVRKLDDVPGGPNTFDMLKMKNLDFCKSLESLRNMTIDNFQGESLMPPNFLISCPLTPGFYYMERSYFDVSLLPFRINDGRYLVHFELVQVYEELNRLLNCKVKVSKKTSQAELDSKTTESSMEESVTEDSFENF